MLLHLMPLAAAALLSGCASTRCDCPAYNAVEQAVERDFSQRADGSLLRCTGAVYTVRLRVVKPKE